MVSNFSFDIRISRFMRLSLSAMASVYRIFSLSEYFLFTLERLAGSPWSIIKELNKDLKPALKELN